MTLKSTTFELPVAYRVAKKRLLERLDRDWEQGTRLPPINKLAKLIDAGQRNTGLAVRELVREGVLVSKPRLGTYVTGNAPQQRDPKKTGSLSRTRIALLRDATSMATDVMIQQMVHRFSEVALHHGAAIEEHALEYHNERFVMADIDEVDVVVAVNPHSTEPIHVPADKIAMDISTSNCSPIVYAHPYDWVTVDQEQGAALAGRLLTECGFCAEQVCYIGVWDHSLHTIYDQISTTRLWGAERELGGKLPQTFQLKVSTYGEFAGAGIVKEYLELGPRPEAIFAASDELAVGFVKGAAAHGLKPGRDYQIIGFDGQQRGRDLPNGPLSTVQVPASEMGRRAAELLVDRVADRMRPSRRLQLGCELIRGTTVRSKRS